MWDLDSGTRDLEVSPSATGHQERPGAFYKKKKKMDEPKLDDSMDMRSSWRQPCISFIEEISEVVKQNQTVRTCFLKIKLGSFSEE